MNEALFVIKRASVTMRDTRLWRWVTIFPSPGMTDALATGYVSSVRVLNGGLLVTFGGPRVSALLRGRHAYLEARMVQGDVQWACAAPDVPRVALPATCR